MAVVISEERAEAVRQAARAELAAAKAAYEEAQQRLIADIEGETPEECAVRKLEAHQAMVDAERRQQIAYSRELSGRMMSQGEVSIIAQAVDQYGGASAWHIIKQHGHEADAAHELPEHLLQAVLPYADAEKLPRPADVVIALFRTELASGNIENVREAMAKLADRFNFNDLHIEAEQQARVARRSTAREQYRVSFVDHRRLAPGERLRVAVQDATVERITIYAPAEPLQQPRHAPEVPNVSVDTAHPSVARYDGAQTFVASEASSLPEMPAVPALIESVEPPEARRIIELARQGLSRRKICAEVFGATGGRAYQQVRCVLDAAGL